MENLDKVLAGSHKVNTNFLTELTCEKLISCIKKEFLDSFFEEFERKAKFLSSKKSYFFLNSVNAYHI